MATAGLAMVCAYVFLFTERDFSALSRVVDAAVDNTEDVKKAIAQAAALSARETEVLSLALRGRTTERIAQELFIAKSWADFQSSFMSNMATFMRDGRNLDDQTKEVMAHAIKNLGDVAGHTLRERLGATIERMKEAMPFIDAERDNAQNARKKS